MASKTWFITGSSRGFGRVWAEAALKRGDRVAATARDPEALAGLVDTYGEAVLALPLDVTDREAAFATVDRAHRHFGRLDVIVNNAGYGLFGALEETTEEQARAQLETNVFGALWVTQAALPHLRTQGGGHLIQTSSIGGVVTLPNLGLYHASKWALEGFSESMAQEVAEFGIHVTLVEPGDYATDWNGNSAVHTDPLPAYDGMREKVTKIWESIPGGDPAATGPAILRLVDAENPPLRLFLGAMPLEIAKEQYAQRLATWEEWSDLSRNAQGN
ncbi:SDR family oxidoreductase [Streptomyces iconiensis]|uniref:SDR family oxidoreductase n=1 Tax=Streptomyces iconiensis TaxID=1384038 RepID=A0ABT6ZNB6_9ACTN|nr:SDR family oxidoreductase [Streptomyces iconiensis]MDJ1130546.1 SDR family oxidoreductase [Streptomyces iconiensis]